MKPPTAVSCWAGSSRSRKARLACSTRIEESSVTTPLGIVSSTVSSSRRRSSSVMLAAESCEVEALGDRSALFEIGGHVVERADQLAKLLGGLDGKRMLVVAGGNLIHGVGQRLDRTGDLLREKQRQPAADKENERGQQQQDRKAEPPDAVAHPIGRPIQLRALRMRATVEFSPAGIGRPTTTTLFSDSEGATEAMPRAYSRGSLPCRIRASPI
jgi:hypothetical protein